MLYKGDKDVSVAAQPPKGGRAEAWGLSVSSLPWSSDRPTRMPDSPLKSFCTKQRVIALPRLEEVRIAELPLLANGRLSYFVSFSRRDICMRIAPNYVKLKFSVKYLEVNLYVRLASPLHLTLSLLYNLLFAQSAGDIEILTAPLQRGKTPHKECPGYDTKHCHCLQVHSGPEW